MVTLTVQVGERSYRVTPDHYDLSIPLSFGGSQLRCFGAPPAQERTYVAGSFTGDVRRGGSCNCATYTLTPHCNGTHTECVGHITGERLSIHELCRDALLSALLISVEPQSASSTTEHSHPAPQPGDFLVSRSAIETAVQATDAGQFEALVIRTLPNDDSKRTRDYGSCPAPYFSAAAMEWIVQRGIQHLVVDLPSVDRAEDEGILTAHRIFWGMPRGSTALEAATRRTATITELAYIHSSIPDGFYLLNLQIAPFASDAAPSRPILMALRG